MAMKKFAFILLLLPSLTFAIKPVSNFNLNQAARAMDFYCPAGDGTIPICYFRLIETMVDPNSPMTFCYALPNVRVTIPIEEPISLTVFLPTASGPSIYPYIMRPGIWLCP